MAEIVVLIESELDFSPNMMNLSIRENRKINVGYRDGPRA